MHPRKHPLNGEDVGPASQSYYSTAVRADAGPLLFVAGQVAWDENHKILYEGDIKGQTRHVLERIATIVGASGGTMDDLVNLMVFTTDMRWFEDIAEVRRDYFTAPGPASTMVEVAALALPGLLIEMHCVAVVG
jgi:2-iminobutanoate/2-iminopropanoate deaminase